MKRMFLGLMFGLFIYQTASAGGGWTKDKGQGFVMLSQRFIGATFYSTNNLKVIETPFSGVLTTNIFAEYGLGKNFEVFYYSPILSGAFVNDGITEIGPIAKESAFGIGDMDLGLKYGLLKGKFNLSVSLMAGIPSGNNAAGKVGKLMLGDGEFNQLIKLEGSGMISKNWYMTGMLGFNHRTRGFSEEIHAGLEFGLNKEKYLFILKTYMLKSLNNGDAQVAQVPGIYSNNLEYVGVSPCFLYKIGDAGLMIDLGFAPYLRNIIAAPSFTIGYFLNF